MTAARNLLIAAVTAIAVVLTSPVPGPDTLNGVVHPTTVGGQRR